jgi:hypothetical protein
MMIYPNPQTNHFPTYRNLDIPNRGATDIAGYRKSDHHNKKPTLSRRE